MNRKQRRRKLKLRQEHLAHPSAAKVTYTEVAAKARRQKKGESYILTQMQKLGFLPDGKGGWRAMTEREQEMWT